MLVGLAFLTALLYLAVQAGRSTHTVEASTELEKGRLWSELLPRVAHSPDMADIWDEGHTNSEDMAVRAKRRSLWFLAGYPLTWPGDDRLNPWVRGRSRVKGVANL